MHRVQKLGEGGGEGSDLEQGAVRGKWWMVGIDFGRTRHWKSIGAWDLVLQH